MSIRGRLRQIDELVNERWLGISTTEYHLQHDNARPDFRGYSPTAYRDWRIMRRHFAPRGSFIDYGAGLGRVTILAARMSFDRVIGLDLDRNLVERGNQNIRAARKLRCPAEIVCRDAMTFPIPHDATALYFCNPFSGTVLAAVLDSVRRSQLDLQLVCNVPPASGFEHEMRAVPWLELQNEVALSDGRKCLIFAPRTQPRPVSGF
jgi:SAM-dependent methyltransferase